MGFFHVCLILATLLCSLVAGFLFAFAVVVMPGIKTLDDKGFIRAFQVIDGVIQKNQPVFILVWIGSAIALIAAAVLGFGELGVADRFVMITALTLYLLAVQLSTIVVNIPLNNRLQTMEIDSMDEAALKAGREAFEPRWNRWNVLRTFVSIVVTTLLIVLLLRL